MENFLNSKSFNTVIGFLFVAWFLIIPLIVGLYLIHKKNELINRQEWRVKELVTLDQEIKEKKEEAEKLIKNATDEIYWMKKNVTEEVENMKLNAIEEADKVVMNATDRVDKIEANAREKIKKLKDDANQEYESTKKSRQKDLDEINKTIREARKELDHVIEETIISSYNFTSYDGYSSEECKNKLSLLKVDEQELIKSDRAVIVTDITSAKKVANNNIKQLLRCFNAECDNIFLNLNAKNIDSMRSKITKSFESLNKVFETDKIALNKKLLEFKLDELNLVYTYELKKNQEREEQKVIREQMLEEEKVRREIEREKDKIAKEEAQFKNEVNKLMAYMQKSSNDIEKTLYIDKINELEDKLKAIEKDKENVLQREQNTRAGYVYIISNIGSFGENVYKIGMTRRLEPMDRVKELSDASVPFPFDVHAMIFAEDAPNLENILHQTFRKYEVNKVNARKEFFKIDLNEIEKIVKQNHNATVHFTLIADANEYRQSLKISS